RLLGFTVLGSLTIVAPVMSLEALTLTYLKIPQAVTDALMRLITAKTYPELIYVLAIAAFGAAVSEEFVFRGILQRSIMSRLSPWASIVVASAVFALLHTIWRMPPALVLGIFLGFLYWRTQSLVMPMVAHFTINTVSVVVTFVTERRGELAMLAWIREDKPAPAWLVVVSLAVFALAVRVLWKEGAPAASPGDLSGDSMPVDPAGTPPRVPPETPTP
ncbi:MAG TPA: CPBP family intramembrane glutamic endopeptidase, partial [bacterium]|nr:CPBP family intramembrane glutamic endopeptidase [bacterium]